MNIFIDLILITILIGSTYSGYKRGLVDVGFKLFALIISIIVTLILFSPITSLIINNTDIDEKIEDIVVKNGVVHDEKDKSSEENGSSKQSSAIDSYINNYSKGFLKNAKDSIIESAAKPISRNIVAIAVMIILFLLTRIILAILKIFTDILTNIPIIKQCNELAGLIYGLLIGLVIVYVLLAITFFIISLTGDTTINTIVEQTYITKFFYNNNIILKLLF